MPRMPKVQRTPEEKWQIVLEGLQSGNVAETCRKYEIAPTLYYRAGGAPVRPEYKLSTFLWVPYPFALFAKGWARRRDGPILELSASFSAASPF